MTSTQASTVTVSHTTVVSTNTKERIAAVSKHAWQSRPSQHHSRQINNHFICVVYVTRFQEVRPGFPGAVCKHMHSVNEVHCSDLQVSGSEEVYFLIRWLLPSRPMQSLHIASNPRDCFSSIPSTFIDFTLVYQKDR